MSREMEKMKYLSYNYVVVKFLEHPYDKEEDLACVPSSWIRKEFYTEAEQVIVSYPNENPLDTRKRVIEKQKFSRKWSLFQAIMKHRTNSIEDADIFILAHSSIIHLRLPMLQPKISENLKKIPLRTAKEIKPNFKAFSRFPQRSRSQIQINIKKFIDKTSHLKRKVIDEGNSDKSEKNIIKRLSKNSVGSVLKPVQGNINQEHSLKENHVRISKKPCDQKVASSDQKLANINNKRDEKEIERDKASIDKISHLKRTVGKSYQREDPKNNTVKKSKELNAIEKIAAPTSTITKISPGKKKSQSKVQKTIKGEEKIRDKCPTTSIKINEVESTTEKKTSTMDKVNVKEFKIVISVSRSGPNRSVSLKIKDPCSNYEPQEDIHTLLKKIVEALFKVNHRKSRKKKIAKSPIGINKVRCHQTNINKDKFSVTKNKKLQEKYRLLFGSSDEEDL